MNPQDTSHTPWVDEANARVNRRVFHDPGVHELELERIFGRHWLYLGHVSEVPLPGDYVTRPMGKEQVVVTRGEDGQIRAFLNSCTHRGMALTRADAGNARRFTCPYHGWTFDTSGALRSTSYDQHYTDQNLSRLGLLSVPRVAQYQGLIFGNWDAEAAPLEQHLGDVKWYLDLLFGRTPAGMSVLGPPQRWVVETNWKIPAINFLDTQHALRTHRGPLTLAQDAGAPPLSAVIQAADNTPQISFPQGHGIVLRPAPPGLPPYFGYPPTLHALYEQMLRPEQLQQFGQTPPQVGTIFPNTSWVEPLLAVAADRPPSVFLSLRNWQPIGPDKTEIWSWYFAEVEAPAEWRAEANRLALQTFGMGGTLEEDDAEVWASISRVTRGPIASRQSMDFSAGRGVQPVQQAPGVFGPGTVYPSLLTEHAQFAYILQWQRAMQSAPRSEASQ